MQIAPIPIAKELWEGNPANAKAEIVTPSNASGTFSSEGFVR